MIMTILLPLINLNSLINLIELENMGEIVVNKKPNFLQCHSFISLCELNTEK